MFFALVAAVGLTIGLTIARVTAPVTARPASAGTRVTRVLARDTPRKPSVPTINVPPNLGSTCDVAGQSCSIDPCVEFVAATPARPAPSARASQPIGKPCAKYPDAAVETVPAGH
jgi:hypothetical protein